MNPKDRNAVIEECLAAVTEPGFLTAWANAIVTKRLNALLSPIDRGDAGTSECQSCGAEYPSAPLGTLHKCGKCEDGICLPKGKDRIEAAHRLFEQGKMTFDKHANLRATKQPDHSPDAGNMVEQPDWTPEQRWQGFRMEPDVTVAQVRENAIRECIEKLPKGKTWLADPSWLAGVNNCQAALESLLPKQPDRAEELVAQYFADCENGKFQPDTCLTDEGNFARWALSRGEIK